MKNLLFMFFLSIATMQSINAQNQAKLFDEMMTWVNTQELNSRSYKMMWSNNTLRTGSEQPNGYQYLSYAHGQNSAPYPSGAALTDLVYNISQSFVEPYKEVQKDRDRLAIKIYKSGTTIKVDETLLSWGNGVTTHTAIIERAVLGGYVLRYKSTNGSTTAGYSTILLNRSTGAYEK